MKWLATGYAVEKLQEAVDVTVGHVCVFSMFACASCWLQPAAVFLLVSGGGGGICSELSLKEKIRNRMMSKRANDTCIQELICFRLQSILKFVRFGN